MKCLPNSNHRHIGAKRSVLWSSICQKCARWGSSQRSPKPSRLGREHPSPHAVLWFPAFNLVGWGHCLPPTFFSITTPAHNSTGMHLANIILYCSTLKSDAVQLPQYAGESYHHRPAYYRALLYSMSLVHSKMIRLPIS